MDNKTCVNCPCCAEGKMVVVNSRSILRTNRAAEQPPVIDNDCLLKMIQSEIQSKDWQRRVAFICINCNRKYSSEESAAQHSCIAVSKEDRLDRLDSIVHLQCVPNPDQGLEESGPALPEESKAGTGLAANYNKNDDTEEDLPADYLCNVCNTRFDSAKKCLSHPCASRWPSQLRALRKATACPACQKEFLLPVKLRQHVSFCHPLMTIVCQICEKGFPKKYLLKVHMRSHTGDNPYRCDHCGKQFPSSSILWSHKKFAHLEKAWECETCGEKLANRQTLDNHVRMKHTKDRTLRCKVCEKTFLNTSVLYQHTKSHSDVRKYQCGRCQMTFRRSYTLQNHERIHSGERPYPCPTCGKAFRQRGDMRKHCSTQHPTFVSNAPTSTPS